jgi:hypothetical protein
MPMKNAGETVWARWLRLNQPRLNEVRGALVESVDEFQRASGVDMMADLLTEMSRQGFALLR